MDGYVATIGMFDGVHRGHQFVLQQVVATAHERGLQSMAVTFGHTVRREPVLTPLDEKLVLLSKTGVDRMEVLEFSNELRQMTAREFMRRVLRDQLHVRVLLTGYDNRFGHGRTEGFDDYVRHGRELGIEVTSLPPAPPQNGQGQTVSSSYIRQLLLEGRVSEAANCLGYPYTMTGHVAHGEHIGTSLGFPTANLVPDDENQLIPASGVYAIKVRLPHSVEHKHGMMNIGQRPTFDGHRLTMEAHIFQLHEDLYGQQLMVSFVEKLRDEQRFDNREALIEQLKRDAEQTEQILNQKIEE